MRCLLDTHTLIWWMTTDPHLSRSARTLIEQESTISLVSAASAWEIATKVRLGRLPAAADLVEDFVDDIKRQRMEILAVSAEHGIRAGLLPGPHKDPFDRMLIAQAQAENVPILSNDRALDGYGVRRLW
ncbi:MAG TPA: type II toxin-antitoxin system VapC family toxin [Verrucomicrobiae bacterium]|nr:type II toxin-antitoxin system VapC family toxin [Verrucomicrobiae bacterium]